MKCLLCDLENNNNEELEKHLIHFPLIDKDNCLQKTLKISPLDSVKNVKKILEAGEKKKSLFFVAL